MVRGWVGKAHAPAHPEVARVRLTRKTTARTTCTEGGWLAPSQHFAHTETIDSTRLHAGNSILKAAATCPFSA